MVSSYTSNKRIEKPGYGDYAANATGWSGPINTDWDIIDAAFGDVTNLTQVTGTHTLGEADYRNLVLQSSSVLTGNVRYNIPSAVGGQWIVRNATSGNSTFTIGTTNVSGTTVAVAQGQTEIVYSDKLGNIRIARPAAEQFPVGGIIMWSGVSVPTGWFLCNGQTISGSLTTPDLRDKFIVGSGGAYAIGATGGSANAVLVSHTHTATVTDPGHGHDFIYANGTQNVASQRTTGGLVINQVNNTVQSANTANATVNNQIGSNTTGVTVANSTEGVSGTNANLPPYYALAYIMRGPY